MLEEARKVIDGCTSFVDRKGVAANLDQSMLPRQVGLLGWENAGPQIIPLFCAFFSFRRIQRIQIFQDRLHPNQSSFLPWMRTGEAGEGLRRDENLSKKNVSCSHHTYFVLPAHLVYSRHLILSSGEPNPCLFHSACRAKDTH